MARKPKNTNNTDDSLLDNQDNNQDQDTTNDINSEDNQEIISESDNNSEVETPVVNQKDVVPEVPPVIPSAPRELPVYPVTILSGLQRDLYEKLNTSAKVAFTKVLYYVDKMAPGKPLSDREINNYQLSLYSGICALLNEKEKFNEKMHLLLQIFNDHSDKAFKETHVMRNMHSVELDRDDLLLFQTLTTAFRVLAPVTTRKMKLRTVDLSRRLFDAKGSVRVSEEARQRLLTYFDVENN